MELYITDNCIKCGACAEINGDIFEISEYGAIFNKHKLNCNNETDCYDAVFFCPVNAIHFGNITEFYS